MPENLQSVDGSDQLRITEQYEQQLLADLAQFTKKMELTDPTKAQAVSDFAPNLLATLDNEGKFNGTTDRQYLQTFFETKTIQEISKRNKYINHSNPSLKNQANTILIIDYETHCQTTTIDETLDEEENEATKIEQQKLAEAKKIAELKAQIKATEQSQSATLTAHPDLAQSVSSATDLDISPTDTPEAKQEKQAKQEQVAQQLWTTTAELQKKIDNSEYSKITTTLPDWTEIANPLSIGQLLSFLQTEQALYTNGISEDAFLGDVVKIRTDLQITEVFAASTYERRETS